MKSFFKKLSLVLAAAMVITMVPAQVAKAAPVTLKIAEESKKAEAVASPTYNLKVKDEIDLTFVGATGYNSAAAATKKWSSKDTTVATVDAKSGVVKALKPGTTVITVICTAKGIDYQGTATIIVSDSKTEVLQTGQEVITAFFANEADATAAAKTAKIYLVQRAQKTTRLRETRVTPRAVEDTVVFEGLADGLEYQVNIAGGEYLITMSVGDADKLIVEYPVAKTGTGTDLKGTTVKSAKSKPVIKVLDADGKEIKYDLSKMSFSITEHVNQAKVDNNQNSKDRGTVTFTSGDPKSSAKVKVTYKYTNSANKSDEKTIIVPVKAEAYVLPTLSGWAESIVAVPTNTLAKNITYPTTENFSASLNVGEELNLAYYILASDGNKYTGNNVSATAKSDDLNIAAIGHADYKFYFEKDDTSLINISLPSPATQIAAANGTVTVRAWKQGTETISLYRAKDKTKADSRVDMYLGSITITVNEERRLDRIVIEGENSVTGYVDADKKTVELPIKAIDQFGDPIYADITVSGSDSVVSGISASVGDGNNNTKKGVGKVVLNFANIQKTPANGDPYTVKLSARYNENVVTELSVEALALQDDTNAAQSFKVEIDGKNATITNKSFANATNIGNIGFTVTVGEYLNEIRVGDLDFTVVKDNFASFEDAIDLRPYGFEEGDLIVAIFDADDNVVKKNAVTGIGTAFATGVGAAYEDDAYFFDLYNKTTELTKGIFTLGTYKAVLYQVDSEGAPYDLSETATVEVANNMTLITDVDSTYQLTIKDKKVVRKTGTVAGVANQPLPVDKITGTYGTALLTSIVGSLYGWFDKDSDGEAEAGEVDTILALTKGFSINMDLSKCYNGAAGEAYINYVVIEFYVDGSKVQERINIDRKFQIK